MKFVLILLCLITLSLCQNGINKEVKKYKFKAMFPSTSLIPKPDDKLIQFTYKNINLSENEIQIYTSTNDNDSVNLFITLGYRY
jgi:hypothetical protein